MKCRQMSYKPVVVRSAYIQTLLANKSSIFPFFCNQIPKIQQQQQQQQENKTKRGGKKNYVFWPSLLLFSHYCCFCLWIFKNLAKFFDSFFFLFFFSFRNSLLTIEAYLFRFSYEPAHLCWFFFLETKNTRMKAKLEETIVCSSS